MRRLTVFLFMVLAPSFAYANAGIFEGSGHTIKLVHSEDVQLRSETVRIIPGRGWYLFNGSVGDRVDYECKFVLKNRSKEPVTIQVGFPLTSQFLKYGDDWKAEDATALVLKYRFIVRDNDRTYHVRFVPHDQAKTLGAIFLWDMTFHGEEVRELNVAYEIPMAMGLGDTMKDPEDPVRRTQELQKIIDSPTKSEERNTGTPRLSPKCLSQMHVKLPSFGCRNWHPALAKAWSTLPLQASLGPDQSKTQSLRCTLKDLNST